LTALLLAESREHARALRLEVTERLEAHRIGADFRPAIGTSAAGVARRIQMEGPGAVVIPCEAEGQDGEQLCTLVDEIPSPVLLVH
jgi:hypothetical protein